MVTIVMFINQLFLANRMRKSEIPGELSLAERVEELNENMFDGELDSLYPRERGRDVMGRNFVIDKDGIVQYGPPTAENPGTYRLTADGRVVRQRGIKKENGELVVQVGKWERHRVMKGILVPESEYLEEIASSQPEEIEEGPEEEIPARVEAPISVSYKKPTRRPLRRYPSRIKLRIPQNRERMHYARRDVGNVLGEPKSITHHLNENFTSVPSVVTALSGKPPGMYIAPVNGKARKFLVSKREVKIYGSMGVAEELGRMNDVNDGRYSARLIKMAREEKYNRKMGKRYK
jgi:hypothetical protein